MRSLWSQKLEIYVRNSKNAQNTAKSAEVGKIDSTSPLGHRYISRWKNITQGAKCVLGALFAWNNNLLLDFSAELDHSIFQPF